MLKVFFSLYAKDILSPELLFEILNQEFFNYLNSGEYFTSFYGIYFRDENKFIFTNANHPAPLLLKYNKDEIIPLNTDGFFVGIFKDSVFEEKEVLLEKGDRILFFTDGILEAKAQNNEEFGLERVKKIYIEEKKTCLQDLINIIKNSVLKFTGMNIEDDITILGLEIE
jgi:sigma-B regulation protein RsbU (phosphoserine phosphatase)